MKLMTAAASGLGGTTKNDLTQDGSQLTVDFAIPTHI